MFAKNDCLPPPACFGSLKPGSCRVGWGRLAIPHLKGRTFYCILLLFPLLCWITPNVHHLVFYWVVGFLVGLYYATFFGTAFSITLVLSPQKKVASRSVRSVCKGLKALCEASVRFWEKQWQKVPTFPTEDSGTSKIWANYFYFPKLLNLNGSEPPTTISVDPGSFTKPPRPGHGTQHSQRGSGRSTSWKHQHPRGVEECCSQTLTTNQGWWGNRGPEFSPQNHMFSQSERIGPTEFGTNSKSNLLPASLGVIYGEPRNWCRFKSSCTVSLFANSIALGKKTYTSCSPRGFGTLNTFFFSQADTSWTTNSLGISGLGFLLLHIIFLRFQMKMQENAGEYSFFFLHLSSPYIFSGKRTKHENIWFDGRPWDPYHNNWEPLISTSWNSKTALPKNHETSGPWYS